MALDVGACTPFYFCFAEAKAKACTVLWNLAWSRPPLWTRWRGVTSHMLGYPITVLIKIAVRVTAGGADWPRKLRPRCARAAPGLPRRQYAPIAPASCRSRPLLPTHADRSSPCSSHTIADPWLQQRDWAVLLQIEPVRRPQHPARALGQRWHDVVARRRQEA